jgi:large subunit ribosomal protein L25
MPEILSIDVQPRTVTGKKVSKLRRANVIPGVVYGHGAELAPVQVDERSLDRFLARLSASSLINVVVAGEEAARPAIIREVQRNPLNHRVEHIDFLEVSLKERIRADVPITFSGESPAVVDGSGVLVEGLSTVEVECLPMELPQEIVVDLSKLANIDDVLTVGGLQVPEGVTVHTPADHLVARIIARREIVEEEVVAEAPGTPEVEVIAERKVEERRTRTEQEGSQ